MWGKKIKKKIIVGLLTCFLSFFIKCILVILKKLQTFCSFGGTMMQSLVHWEGDIANWMLV
jgi:hypothetical protein